MISSQERLDQFQPKLVGNMLEDGDSVLFKYSSWPFFGPIRGKIRTLLINWR